MNGDNSNTSGSKVANLAYWPSAILPRVVDLLGGVITSLKGLVDSKALPAAVDFSVLAGSDKIADAAMEEIARRLIVTFEKESQGNVLFQPTAPDDHTKAWWQTDAVTGLPIGRIKQWNEQQAKWVNVEQPTDVYVAPLKRNGRITAPAGTSTQNFPFQDILTSDYKVILTPTTYSTSSNSWLPAPISFPTTFGYVIVNKTNTLLSIAFFGVPTGGITWEVDVEDRKTTA